MRLQGADELATASELEATGADELATASELEATGADELATASELEATGRRPALRSGSGGSDTPPPLA
ncbi:MAG: hypothetical protein U5M23_01835 [Marinagarivorans sp.]|nr:hypothetical protein [Marinagarivorans sp.]